jgi:hypothetical protein
MAKLKTVGRRGFLGIISSALALGGFMKKLPSVHSQPEAWAQENAKEQIAANPKYRQFYVLQSFSGHPSAEKFNRKIRIPALRALERKLPSVCTIMVPSIPDSESWNDLNCISTTPRRGVQVRELYGYDVAIDKRIVRFDMGFFA